MCPPLFFFGSLGIHVVVVKEPDQRRLSRLGLFPAVSKPSGSPHEIQLSLFFWYPYLVATAVRARQRTSPRAGMTTSSETIPPNQ